MKKLIMIAAAAAVIAGVGSFYGGMKFAEAKGPMRGGMRMFQMNGQAANGAGGAFRGAGGARGGMNGGLVSGEILSNDGKTLTVKLRDGGSKIVLMADSTNVSRLVEANAADLKVGDAITVTGSANADGSLTAQMVQLRPAGMGFPGMSGQPPVQNDAPKK